MCNGLATTDIKKVQNFHLGRGARHGDGESVLRLAPRLLRRRRAQRRLPNLQWGGLRGPVGQTVTNTISNYSFKSEALQRQSMENCIPEIFFATSPSYLA